MQPQYARVVRTNVVTQAIGRGELRAKVIEWRRQAGATPVRTIRAPKPVPRWRRALKALLSAENIVLVIMVVASIVIYKAVKAGVL